MNPGPGGHLELLRRPWPRPLIIAVTVVVTLLVTTMLWRPGGSPVREAAGAAKATWEELYGRAVRKLASSGANYEVVNAVGSGVPAVSTMEAGDYRLDFACASERSGVDVTVLVDAGDGARVRVRADCDTEHTFADFYVPEGAAVTIWVGSYQVAQTAYAFAVRSGRRLGRVALSSEHRPTTLSGSKSIDERASP